MQGFLLGVKGPKNDALERDARSLAQDRADAGLPPLSPASLQAEAFGAALAKSLERGRPGLSAVLEGPAGKHLVMVTAADATGFTISDGTGPPRHIDAEAFGAAFVPSVPGGQGGIGTSTSTAVTGYASAIRSRR